jgi:GTP-binding protein
VVSAARPKIADYPFTTLEPNLGVVSLDGREFVIADIPGLIEGAAEGRGLGHEFLRHVERARALVILLDPSPLQEHDVVAQYSILLDELRSHRPDLVERPRVVAVSKADLPEAGPAAERARAAGIDARLVSAATNEGLEGLMYAVVDAVDLAERALPDREGFVLHRPVPPSFEVHRVGDRWVVTGKAAERAIALDDLTKPEAADFAARRLARAGVDDALRDAGARPGDDVQIGGIVFEFRDDDGGDE